jgi:hypothetical protein
VQSGRWPARAERKPNVAASHCPEIPLAADPHRPAPSWRAFLTTHPGRLRGYGIDLMGPRSVRRFEKCRRGCVLERSNARHDGRS